MSMAQWEKEAEEQAKKYSDGLKQNNQYLIDQLVASKNNTLEQLQKQQDNAIYNLNTNQSTINKTAEDNAKQANINRLLALKSNQEAMNRAGLGTQGIVGSQVNAINNSYGSNLTSILNNQSNELRELEKAKNDTITNYDVNRLNLEKEYSNNIANTQKSIEDSALNQYNNIYQTYLALKQQEWEREQAIKQAEEEKRRWEAEYALSQASLRKSSSGGGGGYLTFDGEAEDDNLAGEDAAPENPQVTADAKAYGTFSNGYQPKGVGNDGTLSKSGVKVGEIFGDSLGSARANQQIWKTKNNKYYVWLGINEGYKDVTNYAKQIKAKSNTFLKLINLV